MSADFGTPNLHGTSQRENNGKATLAPELKRHATLPLLVGWKRTFSSQPISGTGMSF